MEWSEFMAYMIDAVNASAIPQVVKEKDANKEQQSVIQMIMQK